MITVFLSGNHGCLTVFVESERTVREILEGSSKFFADSAAMLDGTPLTDAQMDMTLRELGVKESCSITCTPLHATCTVLIVGAVAVLESILTPAQILLFKKYRPDALVVVNKDEKPIFRIDLGDTPEGSLDDHCAAFGTAVSSGGYATITLPVGGHDDPVSYVVDEYGCPINFIHKLEENAVAQLIDLEHEIDSIRGIIVRN